MKKIIFCLFLAIGLLVFSGEVFAQSSGESLSDQITEQNDAFAGDQGAQIKTSKDPREIAALIIRGALGIIGTLFLGYAVYGGFLIMTSAGEDDKMKKGKSTLTTSVIGVAVVLSAYALSLLVVRLLSGPQETREGFYIEPDYMPRYEDPTR